MNNNDRVFTFAKMGMMATGVVIPLAVVYACSANFNDDPCSGGCQTSCAEERAIAEYYCNTQGQMLDPSAHCIVDSCGCSSLSTTLCVSSGSFNFDDDYSGAFEFSGL